MAMERRPWLGVPEQWQHHIATKAQLTVSADPEVGTPVAAVIRIGDGAAVMPGLIRLRPTHNGHPAMWNAMSIHRDLAGCIPDVLLTHDAAAQALLAGFYSDHPATILGPPHSQRQLLRPR